MRAPERRWYWPREDADKDPTPPTVNATVKDRDDIVGTIYGPDDKPLHTVTKPRRPFGYTKDQP